MDSSADALTRAHYIVDRYGNPTSTPQAIKLFPRRKAATLDAALERELRDRVELKFRPPGAASQITTDVFIKRISHDIDAREWRWDTTFEFASAEFFDPADTWFVLDSSVLDGTDKMGF